MGWYKMTNEEMFNALMKEILEIKQHIKDIDLKLENEIKDDIQLLVEGHKTLVNNLERNAKASSTVELNEYRISLLERDIKRLKKEYNMS